MQVLVRDHQGVERMNAELHAHIADMRKRHASTTLDAVFMRQCTTQGGFQTTPAANLFDDPVAVVSELRDSIVTPAVPKSERLRQFPRVAATLEGGRSMPYTGWFGTRCRCGCWCASTATEKG